MEEFDLFIDLLLTKSKIFNLKQIPSAEFSLMRFSRQWLVTGASCQLCDK